MLFALMACRPRVERELLSCEGRASHIARTTHIEEGEIMPSIIGSDTPSGIAAVGKYGVWGDTILGPGVYGTSSKFIGVLGVSTSHEPAVEGRNRGTGHGLSGNSANGVGVTGSSPYIGSMGTGGSVGVLGDGEIGISGRGAQYGVHAYSRDTALYAKNEGTGNKALLGGREWAGEFLGNVAIGGSLGINGYIYKMGGTFRIDHPLDPANKYLKHSFVESDEMKNVYDGVAVLDERGEATVQLPAWFDALNKDFRYQLTCLGGHAPVFIAREISSHSFQIAGGTAGLRVSWQVTGNRKDAWALANPLVVEDLKPAHERGLFLLPELFGEPPEKSIHRASHPEPNIPLVGQPPLEPPSP